MIHEHMTASSSGGRSLLMTDKLGQKCTLAATSGTKHRSKSTFLTNLPQQEGALLLVTPCHQRLGQCEFTLQLQMHDNLQNKRSPSCDPSWVVLSMHGSCVKCQFGGKWKSHLQLLVNGLFCKNAQTSNFLKNEGSLSETMIKAALSPTKTCLVDFCWTQILGWM